MQLLSLELKYDYFTGWVKGKRFYKKFKTGSGGTRFDIFVPIVAYRDDNHFLSVIRNFNSHAPFLPKPVEINTLSLDELRKYKT